MKIYPEDYSVAVTFGFTDLNGDVIVPTSITAKLYNGDDEVVVDLGLVSFEPTDTQKEVVIPAVYNVLGEGQLSTARILRVELTTSAGVIRKSHPYIIEGEFRLAPMINSFQTYEAANLIARDMINLSGWANADQDQRCVALIEAFNRFTRIPMRFRSAAMDAGKYEPTDLYAPETIITRSAWPTVTTDEFLSWPPYFRIALRRAQVVEANAQLEGDVIGAKRRAGIISETVGESSMMLRGGYLDLGVSTEAMRYLAGHVYYNHRIVRG